VPAAACGPDAPPEDRGWTTGSCSRHFKFQPPLQPKSARLPGITRQQVGLPLKIFRLNSLLPPPPPQHGSTHVVCYAISLIRVYSEPKQKCWPLSRRWVWGANGARAGLPFRAELAHGNHPAPSHLAHPQITCSSHPGQAHSKPAQYHGGGTWRNPALHKSGASARVPPRHCFCTRLPHAHARRSCPRLSQAHARRKHTQVHLAKSSFIERPANDDQLRLPLFALSPLPLCLPFELAANPCRNRPPRIGSVI